VAATTDLLTYIVSELSERGFDVTKTALVKLLYLADLEALRLGVGRLSSVRWIFFKYGPYSFEIEDALRQISGREIDEMAGISSLGKVYYRYRSSGHDVEWKLTPEERGIVNRVIDRWGGESLARILSYVYFETEPMAEADWGRPLSFNSVERRADRISFRDYLASRMDPQEVRRLAELKERFWAKESEPKKDLVRPEPEPRYDETFLEGIGLADSEEPH
jgi:hypothetical protein